jgi:hypothetical protein
VTLHTRYRARPLHLFGLAGVVLASAGTLVLSHLTVLWFLGADRSAPARCSSWVCC